MLRHQGECTISIRVSTGLQTVLKPFTSLSGWCCATFRFASLLWISSRMLHWLLMPKHSVTELSYLWGDVQSRIPTGRFWCLEHSCKKRKCAQVIPIKKKHLNYTVENSNMLTREVYCRCARNDWARFGPGNGASYFLARPSQYARPEASEVGALPESV